MSTEGTGLVKYARPSPGETHEAIGITGFSGDNRWDQRIGGLTIQGGKATAAGAISFDPPFRSQLLYVGLAGGTTSGESLIGFTASGAGYWFAVGA